MTIKLIIPKRKPTDHKIEVYGGDFQAIMFGKKMFGSLASTFPTIAGLTPKGIDILFQDENVEPVTYEEKVDLVGITANTTIVERAYEICDEYKKRGIKTILGGIHPSMLPEEGLQHADSVLVGEAENIWPEILEDTRKKDLKRIYKNPVKPCLENTPLPRYDMIDHEKYNYMTVQTTRGCPYKCDFCSVHKFLGNQYRSNSVERILEELHLIKSFGRNFVVFSDDHFLANKKNVKKLMQAMIPLKMKYIIQGRLEVYKDEELLSLLAESGCVNMLVGFESINQATIDKMGKKYNVDTYFEGIEKIQSKGIVVGGSFILGTDEDDLNIFKDTVEFIIQSGMASCNLNILTPLPGTDIYDRMSRENRITHRNWSLYDVSHVCFKPKNMSEEDLSNGFRWAYQQVFKLDTVYERLMNLYRNWNSNRVRLDERTSILVRSLAFHHFAYSLPNARDPIK